MIKEKAIKLRKQGKGYQEIADILGITFGRARYCCKGIPLIKKCKRCGKEFVARTTKDDYCCEACQKKSKREREHDSRTAYNEIIERIIDNPPNGFDYISHRYSNAHNHFPIVKLKCKKCGIIEEHNVATFKTNYVCNNCKRIKKQHRENAIVQSRLEKEREKRLRLEWQLQHPGTPYGYEKISTCPVCGKTFKTHYKTQIYCSHECQAKEWRRKNSNHGKIKKRFAPEKIIDKIALKDVAERDNNVCQICGKPVDWNDYTIKDGAFICGKNYPSIDHIIPCAKGGTHSFDNVQLAHFYCNTLKRDN